MLTSIDVKFIFDSARFGLFTGPQIFGWVRFWQNLTPAERVTRCGRPGYPPWRVTPPIM